MILQLTHDFAVRRDKYTSHVTNMNEWNVIQHIYELFYLKNSHEKSVQRVPTCDSDYRVTVLGNSF